MHRSPEWQSNLNRMLARLEEVKALPMMEPGLHLHMGCGPNILPGYQNIDKFHEHPDIIKYDMYDPRYEENSVSSIYSSHSLEHLPIRLAKLALINWNRVLKLGGRLHLAIPDLEDIMRTMLDPDVSLHVKENWYMYTLFGYQVDPNLYSNNIALDLPVCAGQFHQCGFTKDTIRHYLSNTGYKVVDIFNYNGYDTPSIWVEAVKG